jgi:cell shape-determining protein MreC
MNYVPKSKEINYGEIATTSLFSNLFPVNIIIGKIVKIIDEPGSHFYKLQIQPATKFFHFTQLFVVDYIKDPQEVELIQEVENKILKISGRK